jgi:transcriptional regulator
MYIPAVNRIDDRDLIVEIMQKNSFATLVSTVEGEPVATHLPVLVEPGDPLVLMAHIARANSQWRTFSGDSNALVIFSGPHGYVSPRWYESRPNVPTWNYVSVHAYGPVEIIEDEELALAHLKTMVETFDPTLSELQPDSMDTEYHRKLLRGIVVFRITVERVDAKAKLNQNKSEADRSAVRTRYETSDLADEREMGAMMSEPGS